MKNTVSRMLRRQVPLPLFLLGLLISFFWGTYLTTRVRPAGGHTRECVFHGGNPTQYPAGTCFCGSKDGYCLCTPSLAVDVIVEMEMDDSNMAGFLLVDRGKPPFGLAFPGGFVDVGEVLDAAARREVMEETGVSLTNVSQFRAYSDPQQDPRRHTASVVHTASGHGTPRGGDDATSVMVMSAFDVLCKARGRESLAFKHHLLFFEDFMHHSNRHPCPGGVVE